MELENDIENVNEDEYPREKINTIGIMVLLLFITGSAFWFWICIYYDYNNAPIFIYVFSYTIFALSFMLMLVGLFNGILTDPVKEKDYEKDRDDDEGHDPSK